MSNILSFDRWFKKKKPEPTVVIRTPYARAGETITCTEGHPIADFLVTVYLGDMMDLKHQLGNWRQEEPEIGQIPLPVCAICNANFTAGFIFHFADGWRGWSVDHS